uniref:VWFA domain-containing protein n=1 Tax=Panagrolaimus sp. ES5 TaxID=591445 RepID=A0AC34FG57_9BILA
MKVALLLLLFVFGKINSEDFSLTLPCKSWILFLIDQYKTVGSVNNFLNELNFISDTIESLNHPERISIDVAPGVGYGWHNKATKTDLQNVVLQEPYMYDVGDYSLSEKLSAVKSAQDFLKGDDFNTPIAALIFISDTSDSALAGADWCRSELDKVHATFILLGPNVDQRKLTNFSTNFIHWPDLSKPKPDDWDTNLFATLGCEK